MLWLEGQYEYAFHKQPAVILAKPTNSFYHVLFLMTQIEHGMDTDQITDMLYCSLSGYLLVLHVSITVIEWPE